jgi:hypothetical protein
VLVLAAWIVPVFYADAHPAWRRGASSGRGTADRAAGATPGRPDGSLDGVSGRPEESPAASRDAEAHTEQAAGPAAGRMRL